ncbi:MAG: HEAT repeat domain-containing protein [Deltaproteobacteria bacterium]|nr:HEAT repeat domain-containing protein [Deltaproteobacteria bacterium]
MARKYRALDIERAKYSPLIASLSDTNEACNITALEQKTGSLGWLAIEDLLFNALKAPCSNQQKIFQCFDMLGYVDYYINRLNKDNKWTQAIAADKLGRIRCRKALPDLLHALQSKHKDVRNMVTYSLGVIQDEKAIPHLMMQLKQTIQKEEEVSLRIVKSTFISYGEAIIPALLSELKDPSWQIRSTVVDILGEIGSPAVVPYLIECLKDPEQDIRAKAAKGLGNIKDPSAIPPLIKVLEDNFWVVRLHATRALGSIGDLCVIDDVKRKLSDRNWQVRRVAAEALGRIGGNSYLALMNVFLNSNDNYAKEQAADEIERAGIIKTLVTALLKQEKDTTGLDKINILKNILSQAGINNSEKVNKITPDTFLEIVRMLSLIDRKGLREIFDNTIGKDFSSVEIEKAINEIERFCKDNSM